MMGGKAVAFGLDGLQDRADMFIGPGEEVYEGMIVGENSRTGDHDGQSDEGKEAQQTCGPPAATANILLKPPAATHAGIGARVHRRR